MLYTSPAPEVLAQSRVEDVPEQDLVQVVVEREQAAVGGQQAAKAKGEPIKGEGRHWAGVGRAGMNRGQIAGSGKGEQGNRSLRLAAGGQLVQPRRSCLDGAHSCCLLTLPTAQTQTDHWLVLMVV